MRPKCPSCGQHTIFEETFVRYREKVEGGFINGMKVLAQRCVSLKRRREDNAVCGYVHEEVVAVGIDPVKITISSGNLSGRQ